MLPTEADAAVACTSGAADVVAAAGSTDVAAQAGGRALAAVVGAAVVVASRRLAGDGGPPSHLVLMRPLQDKDEKIL